MRIGLSLIRQNIESCLDAKICGRLIEPGYLAKYFIFFTQFNLHIILQIWSSAALLYTSLSIK